MYVLVYCTLLSLQYCTAVYSYNTVYFVLVLFHVNYSIFMIVRIKCNFYILNYI